MSGLLTASQADHEMAISQYSHCASPTLSTDYCTEKMYLELT